VDGQPGSESIGIRTVYAQGHLNGLLDYLYQPFQGFRLFSNIQAPTIYIKEVSTRFELTSGFSDDGLTIPQPYRLIDTLAG
jgi:hypothetical protein